jgi:hypothetical protein
MDKIQQLPGMYQVGQLVYTTRDIRGWFDKSIKSFIPANTPCTVTGYYCQPEPLLSSTGYHVRFDGKFAEFGDYVISHVDLKLG